MLYVERSRVAALVVLLCFFGTLQRLNAQHVSGTATARPRDPLIEQDGRYVPSSKFETANFRVCCHGPASQGQDLARRAELLRSELAKKWLGDSALTAWNPRCEIVLHASRRSYTSAVGRGSE